MSPKAKDILTHSSLPRKKVTMTMKNLSLVFSLTVISIWTKLQSNKTILNQANILGTQLWSIAPPVINYVWLMLSMSLDLRQKFGLWFYCHFSVLDAAVAAWIRVKMWSIFVVNVESRREHVNHNASDLSEINLMLTGLELNLDQRWEIIPIFNLFIGKY